MNKENDLIIKSNIIPQRASLALLRLAIDKITILLPEDTISNNLFERIAILKSRNIINQEIKMFSIYLELQEMMQFILAKSI
jgi:hypothetical protein